MKPQMLQPKNPSQIKNGNPDKLPFKLITTKVPRQIQNITLASSFSACLLLWCAMQKRVWASCRQPSSAQVFFTGACRAGVDVATLVDRLNTAWLALRTFLALVLRLAGPRPCTAR